MKQQTRYQYEKRIRELERELEIARRAKSALIAIGDLAIGIAKEGTYTGLNIGVILEKFVSLSTWRV